MTDTQGYAGLAGAAVGAYSNILSIKNAGKTVDRFDGEGQILQSQMRILNYNRELIDRQLGDVLSESALATAKNMATAKVLQSKSGTVGGTSALVSKQHYISQIQAEADLITRARNTEKSLMMDGISKAMSYRNKSRDFGNVSKSPMEALIGGLAATISGGTAGMNLGTQIDGAMGKQLPAQAPLVATATPIPDGNNYGWGNITETVGTMEPINITS